METILGLWVILGSTIVLAILAGIFFRLGEIRDACKYLAAKTFRQDVGADDV